ncbi:MAG: hypothetical protein RIC14_09935 [Filomicrobium sp.]
MKAYKVGAALLLSAALIPTASYGADLGGDCCADLEERVAELEATTARKGNRKVSLTIYGQVNEAIGVWDDGFETNTYQFTNDTSRTRFGFKGKAKINSDWYAKFKIEIGLRSADQGDLTADNDDGSGGEFDLRKAEWTIGSKTYGSLTVGEASFATDGVTQTQIANIKHFANPDIFDANDEFDIRQSGTGANVIEWGDAVTVLEPGEGSRGNLVRYNSPTFAGFALSAHWGEDDIWGVALRYATEFQGFKLAAAVGYGEATERDEECIDDGNVGGVDAHCREIGLSASIKHTPSGLFATGAYGFREDDGKEAALRAQNVANFDSDNEFYHFQVGIEQKWSSLGKTTVFGGYAERFAGTPAGSTGGTFEFDGSTITNVDVEYFEIGANQQISAAAMDIYIHYKYYDADITTTAGAVSTEEWQTVIGGARIKF